VGLSTTLVMTVARGVNDHEIGAVIAHAAQQSCCRGVTLQPMQFAGRTDGVAPKTERLTLTEVRTKILEQSDIFEPADVIPVPCNPDALAMGYALRTASGIQPLTRFISPEVLLAGERNTIVFEQDPVLKGEVFKLFATNLSPEAQAESLASLLCCLPNVQVPEGLGYANVFRVLIMAFMDAEAFDVRAMKKSCVHLVQPDGRIIPFESFNLLYRDDRRELLELRRAEVATMFAPAPEGVFE
jgi:uncharacterized radical SAM superfamily Fe-S cluster-containing enzyme